MICMEASSETLPATLSQISVTDKNNPVKIELFGHNHQKYV